MTFAKFAILIEHVVSSVSWCSCGLGVRCPCPTLYGCTIVSSSFNCCLQEWPQWIICLRLTLSSAPSSLTPACFMSSFTAYTVPHWHQKSIALAFSLFQSHHECLAVCMTCPDIHKFNLTCWTLLNLTLLLYMEPNWTGLLANAHILCVFTQMLNTANIRQTEKSKLCHGISLFRVQYSFYFICEDNMWEELQEWSFWIISIELLFWNTLF